MGLRATCHFFLAVFLISVWTTGCSNYMVRPALPERLVLFPPPPDTTRIQFLTHFSGSEDLKSRKRGLHRYLFGEQEPLNIIKPYGITVSGSKIYICDTGIQGIVVMDLDTRAFEYFIPDGKGQLQLPVNCCVDDRGYLFVADANRKQVVVFDSQLNFVHAFGEPQEFKPTDVHIYDNRICVASVEGHSLYLYDPVDFRLVGTLGDEMAGDRGFIRQATNLAAGSSRLYVSDFGDFNIKQFTPEGEIAGITGGYGNMPGSFTRPKGVAVDRDGHLYVVDAAFENVQIFDDRGILLMHFGGSYNGPGAMWLPAAVEISYENLDFFQDYVDGDFDLKYLIFVTNQYGPARVNVYGFVEEKPNPRME